MLISENLGIGFCRHSSINKFYFETVLYDSDKQTSVESATSFNNAINALGSSTYTRTNLGNAYLINTSILAILEKNLSKVQYFGHQKYDYLLRLVRHFFQGH